MSRRLSGGNSPEADGRSCASPSLLVYRRPRRGLSAPAAAPLRSRAEPPLAPHRVLAKVLRLYQVQTPQLGLVIRAPCLGQGLLCALCCGFVLFFFFFFPLVLVFFCFVSFFLQIYTIGVFVPGDDGGKALQECRYTRLVCVHVYVHV